MFLFYIPWKQQKTWGFQGFGGCKNRKLAWNGLRWRQLWHCSTCVQPFHSSVWSRFSSLSFAFWIVNTNAVKTNSKNKNTNILRGYYLSTFGLQEESDTYTYKFIKVIIFSLVKLDDYRDSQPNYALKKTIRSFFFFF